MPSWRADLGRVGPLAQLVEQRTFNPLVTGSNTVRPPRTSAFSGRKIKHLREIVVLFFSSVVRDSASKTGLCRKSAGTEQSRPSELNFSHGNLDGIHQSTRRLLACRSPQARAQTKSTGRLTPSSRLAIGLSESRPKYPSISLLIAPKRSAPRWVMHSTGTPARSGRSNVTQTRTDPHCALEEK